MNWGVQFHCLLAILLLFLEKLWCLDELSIDKKSWSGSVSNTIKVHFSYSSIQLLSNTDIVKGVTIRLHKI